MKAKAKTKKRSVKKNKLPPLTSTERIFGAAFVMCMAVYGERWSDAADRIYGTLDDAEKVAAMAIADKALEALRA
jgi:hypothetical protein